MRCPEGYVTLFLARDGFAPGAGLVLRARRSGESGFDFADRGDFRIATGFSLCKDAFSFLIDMSVSATRRKNEDDAYDVWLRGEDDGWEAVVLRYV